MREIAFDTETTGLEPQNGDRVIEVGCVELVNHVPTGRIFRRLINPGRPVSAKTVEITGITDAILADQPPFEAVAADLLAFIGDDVVIAHNAKFDRGFLNMELERCGLPIVPEARWVDTVALAKARYPGAPASLDALCKRFDVSLESRTFHGALLDAQLLAAGYLELLGGRARVFAFDPAEIQDGAAGGHRVARPRPQPLQRQLSDEEAAAHRAFVETLGGAPVWTRYYN